MITHSLVFNRNVVHAPEQWDIALGDEPMIWVQCKVKAVAEELVPIPGGEDGATYAKQTVVLDPISVDTGPSETDHRSA